MKLNVLIACEESQAECLAFRELGHRAFSCDLQKCRPSGNPGWHILGDVRPYLYGLTDFVTMDGKMHHLKKWHLIIAHPPCTYLCKVSSVQLCKKTPTGLVIDPNREALMHEAANFFYECLGAKADYVAVENPLPMARAGLPKPSCFLHPSWFGVKYTKKTLFWLRNLPPIMAQLEHSHPKEFVRASRGKYRSRTFPEVAQAIAKQWSDYILDDMKNNGSI